MDLFKDFNAEDQDQANHKYSILQHVYLDSEDSPDGDKCYKNMVKHNLWPEFCMWDPSKPVIGKHRKWLIKSLCPDEGVTSK